jgi:hypothetical protein
VAAQESPDLNPSPSPFLSLIPTKPLQLQLHALWESKQPTQRLAPIGPVLLMFVIFATHGSLLFHRFSRFMHLVQAFVCSRALMEA